MSSIQALVETTTTCADVETDGLATGKDDYLKSKRRCRAFHP